jgi:hypothetical protein
MGMEFLRRHKKYQDEYVRSIGLPDFEDFNRNKDSEEIFKGFRFEPKSIKATTYTWRHRVAEDFPKCLRLSASIIGWYESDIYEWLNSLPRED